MRTIAIGNATFGHKPMDKYERDELRRRLTEIGKKMKELRELLHDAENQLKPEPRRPRRRRARKEMEEI